MLTGKQSQTRKLTASHEHYLRAIWEVRSKQGYARLIDVARELKVAPPTLTQGVRTLEVRRLVTHDAHRFLVLKPAGERIAREVHHRFAVLRTFLHDVLGIPDPQAQREACLIEHDVSATTTDRLVDLIKVMREDLEVREVFSRRFAAYHRNCQPGDQCSTCGLACLAD